LPKLQQVNKFSTQPAVYRRSTRTEKLNEDFCKGLKVTDVPGVALETKMSRTCAIKITRPKNGHIWQFSSDGREDGFGMYEMQHT
jgi:hypothetical protein